ncbi:acetyl-CoA carboxylase biotin carboxyl carrier protein subunit [Reichenbachiella ulvae]|uniref:Biotin/lipoyl-binding protein n=1 Tax=Reichenbachiella ulvae TaxID=2980104 RepID=A0ABT3CVX3_9BACT|nr:biotin/lipoyl-containing protein [Reichenbachiella ulvae]MCV9387694.1 biotin/lipoyl-binding protein [Reichenbachiella ulvae]
MKKITIHKSTIELESVDGAFVINGQRHEPNLVKNPDGSLHMLLGQHSFTIDIVSSDPKTKQVSLLIDGRPLEVNMKDELDLALEKIGFDASHLNKENEIKAPMPGTILGLMVKEGDEVKEGDTLLILEAMKMENVIKSPTDGTVQSLLVQKGDAVEKGKILLIF